MPPGEWVNESYMAAMSFSLARSVLQEPHRWPPDIVQMASDLLTVRLAKRTRPLLELATAAHWFDE
ncbi:hypothetical protein GCM10007368_30460 [Isoptericola cucumis]|uniref:Uncharacterized protein n=1 Tax=Isoptericola cucumis TaxID=1776856 RepID=A0ABQ2BA47_9MICO|nr:hypothetical protein GCM10007368_30460 [Isoptericola cucumis]